ncbi:Tetraspanin family-domain-containing protein [Flagelloscypha sp. PMI_526]|nr:Tetraspanin family-domain-containing protein [Flagelloscypha sp. PMI_526]
MHVGASSRSNISSSLKSSSPSRSSTRTLVNLPEYFTQKWPRPLSVRKLDFSAKKTRQAEGTGLVSDDLRNTLEKNYGFGACEGDWPMAKWFLILSVFTLFVYGAAGLWGVLSIWFRAYTQASLLLTISSDLVVLLTLASSIILFTALLGFVGTLLNSRPILALYALLLWPCFISILAPGYISYKRSTYSVERKLNEAWSRTYTNYGRLMIQSSLKCCGYWSSDHGAVPSSTCYSRTSIPGCKGPLMRFTQSSLRFVWMSTFSLVPLHVANILVSLLCANHVTKRFGKGVMPRKYWLTGIDLKIIAPVAVVNEPEKSAGDEEQVPLIRA